LVVALNEVLDSGDEVFDTSEAGAPDGLLSDEPEPSLDLVEPRGVGGDVVDVEARPLCEPEAHLGEYERRALKLGIYPCSKFFFGLRVRRRRAFASRCLFFQASN